MNLDVWVRRLGSSLFIGILFPFSIFVIIIVHFVMYDYALHLGTFSICPVKHFKKNMILSNYDFTYYDTF